MRNGKIDFFFGFPYINRITLKLNNGIFFFFFAEIGLPRFAEPIPNITVTIGRDALLGCVVDNLKTYKVSYLT